MLKPSIRCAIRGRIGFVGYGDADPSNVSSLVHGTEMRVAETRAVNRALRKAYGIGICSVHYRTKGKAFGSLFIENPPRSSTTPSATALRGRGDALTALSSRHLSSSSSTCLRDRAPVSRSRPTAI